MIPFPHSCFPFTPPQRPQQPPPPRATVCTAIAVATLFALILLVSLT